MQQFLLSIIFLPLLLLSTVFGDDDFIRFAPKISCHEDNSTSATGHEHGKKRETPKFTILGTDMLPQSLECYLPTLEKQPLPLKDGVFSQPVGYSGFYAAVATVNENNISKSAVRYMRGMGRNINISTAKLTDMQKTKFEIVPQPLPRYLSSKKYTFVLKFDSLPLAHTDVLFETENGSKSTLTTNEGGKIEITMPNDFSNIDFKNGKNKNSEFWLCASVDKGGVKYTTTLSSAYSPNPSDWWQSKNLGFAVIFVGFLSGMLIYRKTLAKKADNNG